MVQDSGPRVLFVCYANMCRSPLAEAIFRQRLIERSPPLAKLATIDSAGTRAMEGCAPHPLSVEACRSLGIQLQGSGRQILRRDLSRFDQIVLMDRQNLSDLRRMTGVSAFGEIAGNRAQIRLLRAIATPHAQGDDLDIPDPIRGGPEGYRTVLRLVEEGCKALIDELCEEQHPRPIRSNPTFLSR